MYILNANARNAEIFPISIVNTEDGLVGPMLLHRQSHFSYDASRYVPFIQIGTFADAGREVALIEAVMELLPDGPPLHREWRGIILQFRASWLQAPDIRAAA